jgi:NADH:ubiquinone oxidoreductase subunit E
MEKKIKVRICVGTHCYVMGNHELKDLKDQLPADLKERVYVEGAVCLGCDSMNEKPQPPYVEVDGQLIPRANFDKVLERLNECCGKN